MNQQITHCSLTDTDQETMIIDLERELLGYSQLQGQQNGQQNKPTNEVEFRSLILNHAEIAVQSAISKNHERNLPISSIVVAKSIKSEAEKKIALIQSLIQKDEHLLRPVLERVTKLMPDKKNRFVGTAVNFAIGIISAAEGVFAYDSLRATSFPKITALVTATGIMVAIAVTTHIGSRFIRKAKTVKQKVGRYFLVLIPAVIGFFALATIRSNAYNTIAELNFKLNNTPTLTHTSQPLVICIISFIIFLTGLVLAVKFYKTYEQRKQEQAYDQACSERDEIQQRIAANKQQIEMIEKETNIKVEEALARYELAVATENRLQVIGRQAVEVYISHNLRHRTDQQYPAFFANLPTLKYKLFFDNLKKN
ncbi:MAG: hypothetical protein K2Q21_10330 [Chitinophagaceae bacterium]|nr:hypothetical protein [Chitinophagaceae bacterium]